jgi:hypothetical protein
MLPVEKSSFKEPFEKLVKLFYQLVEPGTYFFQENNCPMSIYCIYPLHRDYQSSFPMCFEWVKFMFIKFC